MTDDFHFRQCVLDVDPSMIDSPAIRRIIEEIQNETTIETIGSYNRVNNRHNRGVGNAPGYNRVHNRHNRGR